MLIYFAYHKARFSKKLHVEYFCNSSSSKKRRWMDRVGEEQGAGCVRSMEARSERGVDPDERNVVLGRKRKPGCISTSVAAVHRLALKPVLLTRLNFQPSPASFKPQWAKFYLLCRRRADMVHRILSQRPSDLNARLRTNRVKWQPRTAVTAGVRIPVKTVKLFFRPAQKIPCEFLVQGSPTAGTVEGVEVVSGKPLMRVHFAYLSPPRRTQLLKMKRVFVASVPAIKHKCVFQLIWTLAFPQPKVAQGYEYVSRLMRFGPGTRASGGRRRRPTPWNFTGVYETMDGMTKNELHSIHFMTKYARRDRSINKIRIFGSLDAF